MKIIERQPNLKILSVLKNNTLLILLLVLGVVENQH